MKIECLKNNLEAAVSFSGRVASKTTSLPVLECVLIESKNNKITTVGTNLELGLEAKTKAKTKKEGRVAVPAETLNKFLSSLPNDEKIIAEHKDNYLEVSTKNLSTKIKTMSVDDFPTIPKLDNKNSFTTHSKTFYGGIKDVWYSASTSSMKPELSSVYVDLEDQKITFVATDSFRLAEKKVFGIKTPNINPTLIPAKNIADILRFFELSEGETKVRCSDNQISFESGDYFITTRTTDGNFPDYGQIIPKETKTQVTVLKRDFVDALKTNKVFSNKFNQVYFDIKPQKKQFVLYTKNEDVGESQQSISAAIGGDDLEISFNYRYIMDCFQSIPQDSIKLSFSGLGKPVVISGVGDESFLYLVMPMNK